MKNEQIYFSKYSEAVDHAISQVTSEGCIVGNKTSEEYVPYIASVSKLQFEATKKNGKQAILFIQLYKMDSGNYELNYYRSN